MVSLAGLLLTAAVAHFGSAYASDVTSPSNMTPLQLIRSGRYVQALPAIKQMQAKNPGDPSLNYYLGMCAVSARDLNLAEASFARVVVGSPRNNPFALLSVQELLKLPHRYEPQCALITGSLYRWRVGKQIRIYLSNGRTVPGTGTSILSPEQFAKTVAMAKNTMSSLPIARTYEPGDDRLVMDGIHAWDWAVREKLYSYTFVNDPKAADIIVLWVESSQGYTLLPFFSGQPVMLWAPIDPSSNSSERNRYMKLISAHEFGHALGLCHAFGKADLMLPQIDSNAFINRTSPDQFTSENDRASLRALYSLPIKREF